MEFTFWPRNSQKVRTLQFASLSFFSSVTLSRFFLIVCFGLFAFNNHSKKVINIAFRGQTPTAYSAIPLKDTQLPKIFPKTLLLNVLKVLLFSKNAFQ